MAEIVSPVTGTVARVEQVVGAAVDVATTVVIIESMKMEYAIDAGAAGTLTLVRVAVGDAVQAGDVVAEVREDTLRDEGPAAPAPGDATPAGVTDSAGSADTTGSGDTTGSADSTGLADATGSAAGGDRAGGADPGGATAAAPRADLAEVLERHAVGLDAARPDEVARRHERGHRTARENVADLLDAGTFVEYGPLAIAAQRRRRPVDDLVARTPADGLVAGVGTVDGRPTAVLSYDYTVLAGTQGYQNHRKKDRLFDVIERQRLPVVFFAEGGGGRPGDTDAPGVSGLDTAAFHLWGRLSGLVPRVGITTGRCFAGNAAILGSSDVVIATRGSNIGMGGPAMIEGGGLGVFAPEAIGPVDVQVANGVVDVLVDDEAAAVAAARRFLSYFAKPGAPGPSGGPARPPDPPGPA
ncbi:MAG: carboxyl transferase domain-containing protein, partial [Acidimicrobiales bacterium]